MRLLTWNVWRSPKVVQPLLEVVDELSADVVVLTEVRSSGAAAIRRRFAGPWATTDCFRREAPKELGVLVAAKAPMRVIDLGERPLSARTVMVEVNGVTIVGCYAPLKREPRQPEYWDWLAQTLASRAQADSVVLAGDLNTAASKADSETGRLLPMSAALAGLLNAGWRSTFRELHPDAREFSWWHHKGTGFRIDDALVSPVFSPKIKMAEYCRSTARHRLTKRAPRDATALSDHAAFIVEFELPKDA